MGQGISVLKLVLAVPFRQSCATEAGKAVFKGSQMAKAIGVLTENGNKGQT
jgi:hypothetical protein